MAAEFINLMVAAVLLISVAFILALIPGILLKSIALVLVAVAFYKVFRADQHRKRVFDANNSVLIEQRIAALSRMAASNDFRLVISNSSLMLSVSLFGGFGGLLIVGWAEGADSGYLIGGILLMAFSLLMLFNQLCALGKPLLTITQRGISVRNCAPVFWAEIDSIGLHEMETGTTRSHLLVISVSNPKKVSEARSWVSKLLCRLGFKLNSNIALLLKSNNESPEVVFRICKILRDNARSRTDQLTFPYLA